MTVSFPNESGEYRAARNRLLESEIALRRQMEAVAVELRALPPGGAVLEDYAFDGIDALGQPAKVHLSELFEGARSLIIYNFMFPRHVDDTRAIPDHGETAHLSREDGPCPSCTASIDQFEGTVAQFEGLGGRLVIVAQAPLDRLLAFGRDRGWTDLRLLSSANNGFKRDYHCLFEDGQQAPMVHVFHRDDDGTIRLAWASEMLFEDSDPGEDPRHMGTIEPLWTLFDLTPDGRPHADEQLQYPCCH